MSRVYFVPGQPMTRYLSRNTRSAVAKALNRMSRTGRRHDLAWTDAPDAIDRAVDELVDVHRRRSLQQFGSSPLEDPGVESLFGATVRAHARAKRVRLLTLRIDGALAAFALCEFTAGILWVDTNRASPDWLAFSPGTVVNAEILRMAHGDPEIACVDWGGSVQRYKLSGHPTLVQLQRLQAWSSWWVRAVVACERLVLDWTERCAQHLVRLRRAPPVAVPAQAGGRRMRNS
jgi:CelD/BcsL family acetyltransferase involved in cellulose biosynthesis